MELFFTIVTIILAAFSLYQAGKLGAAIEFDRDIFMEKTPISMHILYWLNLFLGLYMIIVVYGRGIAQGAL